MAKQTSPNMWLGSKWNTKQAIIAIPGGPSGEDPGIIMLESSSGSAVKGGVYLWADSANNLRFGTAVPTDEDSSGSVIGTSTGATTALDNLATVAVNTTIKSDTNVTDDLGSTSVYWRYIYGRRYYFNSTAYIDGTSAGEMSGVGNLSITGNITIGVDDSDSDLKMYSETASTYLMWDGDASSNVGSLIFYGAITPTLAFQCAAVTYTYAGASNALSLTATDNASAALTLGSTGTNGMDVTLQGATSGDFIKWDAAAQTLTSTDCEFVALKNSASYKGLAIPYHATSSPSGAATTGSIFFEVDANKLWVYNGASWVGATLS